MAEKAKRGPRKEPLPDKFQHARQEFSRQYPYFNHVLWAVEWYLMDDINGMQTLAVDKFWRGYYTLGFVEKCTTQELMGVVYHEIRHLILNHCSRMENMRDDECGNLQQMRNVAADLEVNDRLKNDGITMPSGELAGVYPSTYKFPVGLLAEEYFELLMKKKSKPPSNATTCGTCSGGKPVEGQLSDSDTRDQIKQEHQERVIRQVADDIAKNPGNVPGSLRDWANTLVKGTPIPWQQVFMSLVRRLITTIMGQTDFTYAMRSRRDMAGVISPAMAGPQVNLAIVQDTSGSMGDWGGPLIQECLAQVPRIVKGAKGVVHFVNCDAQASEAQRVKSGKRVELQGGGGTDMSVGIAKALTLRPAPQLIIVQTDAYTPWPAEAPPVPVVVAVPPGHADISTIPSWAKVVRLYNAEE